MNLEIVLCGSPHVSYAMKPWRFKVSGTAWVLLAMLVTSERAVTRESLAATLWPDYDRAEGLTNLRRHLHMIAHGLPRAPHAWITADTRTVAWNHAAPAVIDVVEFERLLEAGHDREAVAVYRGELLPQSFDDRIVARRERLRAAYLDALERLIHESAAARDSASVLDYCERLLATDEWREEAVCAWMAAKYESGDGSAALAMYGRLQRRLADEFDALPAPRTTTLRDLISAGMPLPASAGSGIESAADEPAQRGWNPAFAGRSEAMDRLMALWSRTARGSGGIAFISGVAGIGKSRLAGEIARRVRERGGRVLTGTTSNPESEPYESPIAALRSGLDGHITAIGDVWLAPLARVIPEIHSLRTGLAAPPETSLDGARQRLFEAVARALENLGRRQPLYLVLEDLHWAGPATVDLLGALARRVGTLPVMIVATYRDTESPPAVRALQTRLVAERRAIECSLEGLTAGDVSAIVAASIGDASPALRASIAAVSEGNPLFVVQLLANYGEAGEPPPEDALPRGVGDAIAERLRRLDERVRPVAETAATIGESFRAEVLAAAGGWEEAAVLEALESLMDRAIVREAGGTLDYVFSHALFAATLYAESAPERRAARHRRIAAVLERDSSDDAAASGSIARHWKLADEPERAARLYLRAAEAAFRAYARGDTIAFAREVPALTRDPADRFAAYLLISRAQLAYGDVEEWKRDVDALCELAAEAGIEERFAALEQAEAYYHQVGERTKQRAAIDAMLELTQLGLPRLRRIAALSTMGKLHAALSQLPEAVEHLQEALRIAVDIDASEQTFVIRERLVHAYGRLGRYAQGLAEIAAMRESMRGTPSHEQEILILRSELTLANSRQSAADGGRAGERLAAMAHEAGDLETEVTARIALAWASQFDSDVASVRTHYDLALELAERLGYAKGIISLLMDRGSFEYRIGNVRGTIDFYDRAIADARVVGAPTTISYCLVNRAAVTALEGRAAEALACAAEAGDLASRAGGERRLLASARGALAAATIADGELARGLDIIDEAIAIRRELGDTFGLADDLCTRVEVLLELGRDAQAGPSLEEIRAFYEADPKHCEYPVRTCYLLGNAARARADERAARAYFKRGIELLRRELARAPDDESRRNLERRPFNRAIADLAASR